MNLALVVLALSLAAEPAPQPWKIDDVGREALVYVPEKIGASGAPVVFAFHGHGGNMRNIARRWQIHELWPEAIVVYPQGLKTATARDPEGLRPGWQKTFGEQGDRDLKLFDAMLASLRGKHHVDDARIYATGHSNGGGFTYFLWAARPQVLAAVAPSSCGTRDLDKLKPLPAFHLAGRKDRIVPFAGQEAVLTAVRRVNGCETEGKPWAEGCLEYPSKSKTPLVTLIHDGGHEFLPDAPKLIVRFFKEHARAGGAGNAAQGDKAGDK